MKKIFILLVCFISSCSFVDEGKIKEENIEVNDFFKNIEIKENVSSGNLDLKNYDDLENIELDIDEITIPKEDDNNISEDEIEELIDILFETS